jgi:hypothetical protein
MAQEPNPIFNPVEEEPFSFKPKSDTASPTAANGTAEDSSSRALIKFNRLLKHIQPGDEAQLRGYIEDVRDLSPDEAENMEHRLNTALENMGPVDESGAAEDAQETIE